MLYQLSFLSMYEKIITLAIMQLISGLFNIGTGQARSFEDMANAIFSAQGVEPRIEYFDMPENVRGQYQYFTQATTDRIRGAGYDASVNSLEDGIADYVKNYLVPARYIGEQR